MLLTGLTESEGAYGAALRLGWKAFTQGVGLGARDHFRRALTMVEQLAPGDLWCRAMSLAFHVEIDLGSTAELAVSLRRDLLTYADHDWSRRAAMILADHYRTRRDWRKALFYSQLAAAKAQAESPQQGYAFGNSVEPLIALGRIGEATRVAEESLALLPAADTYNRTVALDCSGYAVALKGDHAGGLQQVREGLCLARSNDFRVLQSNLGLTECAVLLEMGSASLVIERAQDLLRRTKGPLRTPNHRDLLFLLGEGLKRTGKERKALECFRRLRDLFEPDKRNLPEILLSLDLRNSFTLL